MIAKPQTRRVFDESSRIIFLIGNNGIKQTI